MLVKSHVLQIYFLKNHIVISSYHHSNYLHQSTIFSQSYFCIIKSLIMLYYLVSVKSKCILTTLSFYSPPRIFTVLDIIFYIFLFYLFPNNLFGYTNFYSFSLLFSLVALGLCCCSWTFPSCGEQGLLFILV